MKGRVGVGSRAGGALLLLLAAGASVRAAGPEFVFRPLWLAERPVEADSYGAFRGTFDTSAAGAIELRLLGAGWFAVWLDGVFVTEGPARFAPAHPEYETVRLEVAPGRHVIAAQVHHLGVTTRLLYDMAPFFACEVVAAGEVVPVAWRASRLGGYAPRVRRINPQLGWIEWCDTRAVPADWQAPAYDDSAWSAPVPQVTSIGAPGPLSIGAVRRIVHPLQRVADGLLANTFGYERDDIPARFFLRDLECAGLPPQGVWRRYDLGRVRLGKPRLVLDLPPGAVVEIAGSEYLVHGRVSPWITLSAGDSCNLDHYVARGGSQEFCALTPKGGRYVEVHVLADPGAVRFVEEEFIERVYHGEPEGGFETDDPLLNRIWQTGIETYRACAEDALIDNPTRERGQWAGDVVGVGIDIAAVAYSDLRLFRRALQQCAQSARDDGLVAGLCPGGPAHMSTYAAQWISGCVHYWELTGDRELLEELFPAAERNLGVFERAMVAEGVADSIGWTFIDWGYVREPGPVDPALNLHVVAALRDMARWCGAIGKPERQSHYDRLARQLAGAASHWFERKLALGARGWDEIGYHCAILGLRLGFFDDATAEGCVAFVKAHMARCFPNDPAAPRNSDPALSERRLITPYFAHYAFPPLIERGEMDFVLDQFRRAWGWMLEEGRTTWVEVFDTRWSHCHQWAGCPTWQLSRYGLGLHPRYDRGPRHYEFRLVPGRLDRVSGALPLPDGSGLIAIQWRRLGPARIAYRIEAPVPIRVHWPDAAPQAGMAVEGALELELVFEGNDWRPAAGGAPSR